MFRKMLKLKRMEGPDGIYEPWLDWQKRSLADAYDVIKSQGIQIDNYVKESRQTWAQHVSRFGLGPKEPHLLKQVVLARCKCWWSYQQMYNDLNLNSVYHATRGKPYSWEDNVGSNWCLYYSQIEFDTPGQS